MLFAEDDPGPDCAPRLAAAGFSGAMIDTAVKEGARLPDLIDGARLAAFTARVPRRTACCRGLAGSLRVGDIPGLAAHRPDYLGFRGGLCRDGDRRNALDARRLAEAVRALGRPDRAGRGVSVRTVVKVGGSLCADSGRLRALLASIAEGAFGPCLVVPGGGVHADAVRAAQKRDGFDDAEAHRRALDAMSAWRPVFSRDRAAPPSLPPLRATGFTHRAEGPTRLPSPLCGGGYPAQQGGRGVRRIRHRRSPLPT